MDKELLEPLFDTLEIHTSRLNTLDKTSKSFTQELSNLKIQHSKDVANLLERIIPNLVKEIKPVDINLDSITKLVESNLSSMDNKYGILSDSLKKELFSSLELALPKAVEVYVTSIKNSLIGKQGIQGEVNYTKLKEEVYKEEFDELHRILYT